MSTEKRLTGTWYPKIFAKRTTKLLFLLLFQGTGLQLECQAPKLLFLLLFQGMELEWEWVSSFLTLNSSGLVVNFFSFKNKSGSICMPKCRNITTKDRDWLCQSLLSTSWSLFVFCLDKNLCIEIKFRESTCGKVSTKK